ncbi:MAG: hypothetical protein VYE73_16570 [Acidobacteriota bacterium]|nr:hypothetical protein [Acidobacteriota bacterium]
MADETGGEALINAQRLQALPTVYADTRDYYWLGFSRDREDDDLHHEIEIEVLRRGVEVRSRTGFIDLSAEAEGDQKVEAALLFDSFAGTSPLELSLGVPLQPYKRKLEVPLDVRIPLESVTMVETAGAFVGELEVRISVMDKEGNQASSEVRALSVEGEGPPAEGSFYTYSTLLEIRNRDHKVVVGVQDILGGGSLAGTAKLDSPYSR